MCCLILFKFKVTRFLYTALSVVLEFLSKSAFGILCTRDDDAYEVLISMKSDLVVKKGWLVGDGLMNDDAPKTQARTSMTTAAVAMDDGKRRSAATDR